MIREQDFRCIYCLNKFGTLVGVSGARTRWLQPLVEHFRPFSLVGTDDPGNLVMACGLCNLLKSADVYETIDEAREEIASAWREKRYKILWIPETSSEEDPDEWTREYARYLSQR